MTFDEWWEKTYKDKSDTPLPADLVRRWARLAWDTAMLEVRKREQDTTKT